MTRPSDLPDPGTDLPDPESDLTDPVVPHLHVLHQPVDVAGEVAVQPVRVTQERAANLQEEFQHRVRYTPGRV